MITTIAVGLICFHAGLIVMELFHLAGFMDDRRGR